jgi:hypothetical protein
MLKLLQMLGYLRIKQASLIGDRATWGKLRQLGFHTTSVTSVQVVVAESNVVAGLDADSGTI